MMAPREVVVLSHDGKIRSEVSAVVARRPGARAVFEDGYRLGGSDAPRAGGIVVLDDDGQSDAVDLLQRLKARRPESSIVYLAAEHSAALESEVRRAGASFYCVKASRDGDLVRVLEVLLARWES
jgi:DNA-binding NarL/FixJ family response regulator